MSNRHLSAIHPFFCGSCYKKAKLPLSPQMRGNIIREEDRTPVLEQVGHGAVLPHFQYALSFLFLVFLRIALFGRYTQNKSFLQVCGHSDFLITMHFFFGICSNRLSFPVFSNSSRMLQIVFSTLMIPVLPSAIMPALQSSCNAWICSSV